jgi:hypothetical protein
MLSVDLFVTGYIYIWTVSNSVLEFVCLSYLQSSFLYWQLAVSSTNKLYTWGSSPQVLRLQAQARKKARLLQQQQQQQQRPLSSRTTTSSSSWPDFVQAHPALDINSIISDVLSEPSSLATAAKSDYIAISMHSGHQESSSTYHNPAFTDSLDGELQSLNVKPVFSSCDSQLPSLDGFCSPSSDVLKSQELSAKVNVNMEDTIPNLPSPVLSNNKDTLNSASSIPNSTVKLAKCHNLSSESDSNKSDIGHKEHVNNEEQSSQSSHEHPLPKPERICEAQVTRASNSEKCMQESWSSFVSSNDKQEEFQSSCKSDGTSWNNNSLHSPVLSRDFPGSTAGSVSFSEFSDSESANMDTLPTPLALPGSSFVSRRMDQNLDFKVCFVLLLTILKYIHFMLEHNCHTLALFP